MTELPPLCNAVDVEALDDLFAPQFDGTPRSGGFVAFNYNGYRVEVGDEGVSIYPLSNEE